MTKFLVIEPELRTVRTIECKDIGGVLPLVGLRSSEVDYGMITRHLAIVVDEFGLFKPAEKQFYTAINGHLYAGNVVIYGVGDEGETVDAIEARDFVESCIFLHGLDQVEGAIRTGIVSRPQMAVNKEVIWQWPQAAPAGVAR